MSKASAPVPFLKGAFLGALMVSAATLAPAQASTFRLGVFADALTIDPIASSDNASIWLELQVYDQLVRPSEDGTRLEPGIAESWTISPDGKQFRFKLRPDAKFSDGQPVTAADVAFSLQRASSEKSEWARFFKPITHYDVVDDHTIVMTLDKPFTPILNNLALFSASILPAKLVEAQGAAFFDHPIGSGPFVLKSWSRGQGQELEKNPNYWEKGKPAIDGASIEVVPEDNSRVLKLKAGELDAIINVPFNQAESLKSDPDVQVGVAPVFRIDLVQLNTTRKPFDNKAVRQALNYALDKAAIVKGILRGNAKPATSSIPVMAYHDSALKPYPLDLAKAKALLAEGGVPDGFKTSMLVSAGDATERQVASAIQASLKKIGVDVALQTIEDSSQFSTTKSGNYEMSLSYATSDTIDPDQLVGFTAVNPERANAFHTQWKSDRVNELYAAERATPDGPERGKQFQEIEQIVHDGAPFIFLYTPNAPYAARKNVSGFEVLPTANYSLKNVVVK
ncbi:ABC transporter substrate-binding protein [Labrys monachus]|uniref:Peptide/nickel transport system substrate-binding protein n=1 Tax=Labrys monachus TaxID=217067 RepID=A0ABU0F935_9HYPH|nr:ABC transporter substrate-binding protein [Labrys monachus]MDQ0391122.1 peptide/nickel transport system substrate-binding protein [Labrys monachus]